jgi:hypothetical protein
MTECLPLFGKRSSDKSSKDQIANHWSPSAEKPLETFTCFEQNRFLLLRKMWSPRTPLPSDHQVQLNHQGKNYGRCSWYFEFGSLQEVRRGLPLVPKGAISDVRISLTWREINPKFIHTQSLRYKRGWTHKDREKFLQIPSPLWSRIWSKSTRPSTGTSKLENSPQLSVIR